MTRLFAVIRHGLTEWNELGRIQGRTDIELSDHGRQLISTKRLPDCLLDASWRSSPLKRARETTTLFGIENALVDYRLIETNWGDWEGQSLSLLRSTLGDKMTKNEKKGLDFQPPNGESPRDVQRRLSPLLSELATGPPITAATTHKGVIRALLSLATGWDMIEKPPVRLSWDMAHVFFLTSNGALKPHFFNVPLVRN